MTPQLLDAEYQERLVDINRENQHCLQGVLKEVIPLLPVEDQTQCKAFIMEASRLSELMTTCKTDQIGALLSLVTQIMCKFPRRIVPTLKALKEIIQTKDEIDELEEILKEMEEEQKQMKGGGK